MDQFHHLRRQVVIRTFGVLALVIIITASTVVIGGEILQLNVILAASLGGVAAFLTSMLASQLLADMSLRPLKLLRQAILHVDPNRQNTPPPNLDATPIGKDLVKTMALQVYQYASQQDSKELMEHRKEIIQASNIVSRLPLPMFVFNKDLSVTNASVAGLEYVGVESADLFGKPIFDNLNLEFQSEHTLETWLADCQNNKVTDTGYWERVRVRMKDGVTIRQCDLSAYFNRDNPSGADFIVTLFDRTIQYNQDDESMGFVALAVHELRTPLTMLRGYIEALEEDSADQLNPELQGYIQKMQSSANQLTSFVHNILNVGRIDNNQLSLQLIEETWDDVLRKGAADMLQHAELMNKVVEFNIQPKLPTVAVDRVSMYEVINNLLDNAIKYSPQSQKIIVTTKLNKAGMIETTVQDFGLGIPASVLPNLFEKFYRNHRTRMQIGGTGLGLYLCKALITAHGGQIWANSKEGEGTTFGFTLLPFSKLSAEQKAGQDGDIVRQAHGWIKNHSYYRR